MALEEYVGAVVVEVDGREIEAFSCSPSANTGRKPVKTMNRSTADRRVHQRRL